MKIGIIGAGQLGRMLALAGYPLGSRFRFLDRSPDAPGAQVGEIVLGSFDDTERLQALADNVDLMTFDVENIPAELLQDIAARVPFCHQCRHCRPRRTDAARKVFLPNSTAT